MATLYHINNGLWNIQLLTSGRLWCAVCINGILVPNQFIGGGISGLALIIHYLFPVFPLGSLYFIPNVPLFIFGRQQSRKPLRWVQGRDTAW